MRSSLSVHKHVSEEEERIVLPNEYFTEFTFIKALLYILCILYVTFVSGESTVCYLQCKF